MTEDYYRLDTIVYNIDARLNWCRLPYHGHPKGCPNWPGCIRSRPDFAEIKKDDYEWFAVVERFDLKAHSAKMKDKFPQWTERQCRNPLYWQSGVRKRLKEKAKTLIANDSILLDIPEACGINMFATMDLVGVELVMNPDLVQKIMIVGRKK